MERFYQQPLFAWLMLMFFPPLGLFCFWYYHHYPFWINFLITIYLLNLLPFNIVYNAAFFVFLILWLSKIIFHGDFYAVQKDFESYEANIIPDLNNPQSLIKMLKQCFTDYGYKVQEISSENFDIDFILYSWFKKIGVKVCLEPMVQQQDIERFILQLKQNNLTQGLLVTRDYNLAALLAAEKHQLMLWNQQQLLNFLCR